MGNFSWYTLSRALRDIPLPPGWDLRPLGKPLHTLWSIAIPAHGHRLSVNYTCGSRFNNNGSSLFGMGSNDLSLEA